MTIKIKDTINGSITGNAGTATILQNTRTINGTNFNGSENITTASWGTTRTLTVGNKSQSVNGSANVTWSLSDIGAAPSSHNHTSLTGITNLSFAAGSSDSASLGMTVSSDTSYFDFNLSDDANTDMWRWRFGAWDNASSSTKTFNAMTLTATSSTAAKLSITGNVSASSFTENGTALSSKYAASSHGTHVNYGGNGSATTVSRSDHTHSYLSTSGGTLTGALTISGNSKNLTMGTGGADVYITNSASGKYLQLKDNGTLSYSDQAIYHSGNPQPTVAKWSTARTLTIGATGKSVDGSGNISWSLQEIMKGQGLNAGTAMNTLYYNNAGVDHVGRLSTYRNTSSNLDYVQVGLYNVANSGTVNTLNVYPAHTYTANEFWCASNIRVNGKRLHITASAPGSPSTGDIWIDI